MTLVVSVLGSSSIWLAVDRRLTFSNGKYKDDATKILMLQTSDAWALLGYSGLGLTIGQTEPGEWMSRVLRGHNLPIEATLDILAKATLDKFPEHLNRLSGFTSSEHHIIIPALIANKPRLYSIDLAVNKDSYLFRHVRHIRTDPNKSVRIMIGGSGAHHLIKQTAWRRELFRAIANYERGACRPWLVAEIFARLVHKVSLLEKTVSSKCIVLWRSKDSNAHQAYNNGKPDNRQTVNVPNLSHGSDMGAFSQILLKQILASDPFTLSAVDGNAAANDFNKLPTDPDDTFL